MLFKMTEEEANDWFNQSSLRKFHLPLTKPVNQHYMLVTQFAELTTIADNAEYTIPKRAGLYSFNSVEERDKAKNRINRATGLDEIAFSVILLP